MKRRNYTPNDNRNVIRMLAVSFAGSAKGRNRILFMTVVLSIITLTMVFGISRGKIRSEELSMIRENGTAASGVVESGTASQYASLKSLDYIKQTGRCFTVGAATAAEKDSGAESEKTTVCTIRWADPDAWKDLLCPAYTKIRGSYPEKESEIMLSEKALKALGITNPQEGMEIPLNVSIGIFQSSEETFSLSGWFADHSNEAAPGYISEKKLDAWGIHPDDEADLVFRQSDRLGWQETEERLYEDLPMKDQSQKITVTDTAGYQAVAGMTGGYGMAVLGTVITLCGVFFLCHNVLQISMAGDIRKLGLLNTIGATQRQLSKIYYSQIRRILVLGTAAGAALSAILLAGVIPAILNSQYFRETGVAEGVCLFHPVILLLSVLFTDGILLAASAGVIVRTVRMSCAESIGYTGTLDKKRSRKERKPVFTKRKRTSAGEMCYLAWRNICGHRKRFILTVLSLFLGLEAFLGAVMITAGSDYVHVVEQRPDFLIAGRFSTSGREQGYGEEYQTRDAGQDPMLTEGDCFNLLYDNDYDEFSPISLEVRKELMEIDGVDPDKSYIMEGAYLYTVISKKGICPLEQETLAEDAEDDEMIEGWDPDTIQILKEDEIESLKKYVESNSLPVDMDPLENGTGVLLLHDHALSAAQEKLAEESIGEPVYFKTMLSREDRIRWNNMTAQERTEQEEAGDFQMKQSEDFTLCGYLDNRRKDFPEIRQTWHGSEGSLYFLISEKGFQRIPTEKKTLYMELNVDHEKDPSVKTSIQKIISEENQRRSRITETAFDEGTGEAGIFCISKSDLMTEAASEIQRNRLILGSISAVLLLAGFTNYFNVMVTGILARKKELKIMESVGMTEKQKRTMIQAEGGYYCLFTVGILMTVGMAALLVIRYYMEQKLSYFKFTWPISWMLLLIAGLAIINVTTAWIMCKDEGENSSGKGTRFLMPF
ncbi:ABC transporter permease [Mediterraneibacter glycyrrhizinilyticus]|uniref:FtsX-like permease family protein n=1 Tax=Mediterraneibacter glycyrrhizinilyticus TaxID=342942 RepID=UPI0025AA7DCC|nr:ABC transporter permease [Mediterraneibacter glycyrrhizinilyticus]MDN0060895.1 ABC transporter permease [Mediterraneibacter glycyrrhizinilyticus]